MKNLIICLLTVCVLSGCSKYKFDEKAQRCRNIENGLFSNNENCK